MNKDDPAFPIENMTDWPKYSGLTKLEWFAGMALQTYINTDSWATAASLAELSFKIAEAMIRESEKRTK